MHGLRATRVSTATSGRPRVDAALLEISQLLALREQIAPFSLDFAVTHKALDFTATRNVLRQLASRQRLGGVAAVLDLLQRGAPSLVESQEDAKVQIERQLRVSCDTFALHCTAVSIGQLTEVLAAQAPATAAICSALDATERAVRETLEPATHEDGDVPAGARDARHPHRTDQAQRSRSLRPVADAGRGPSGASGGRGPLRVGAGFPNPPELAVKGRERSADALFARLPQLTDRERNPFASTGSMRCSTCSLPLADHTSFFSQTGINYHGAVKA